MPLDNSKKAAKKILIFSLAYYPFIGGAEIAIKEITDRIPEGDFEFDLITLRFDKTLPRFERVGNINVYRIGFGKKRPTMEDLVKFPMYINKIFFPATSFLKAWALDRKKRYDAVWCMMSYTGFSAIFLNFFRRRIPIILTLQEGDSISHITGRIRIKIVYPLYQKIFKKASIVQVISTYLGKFAKDMGYTGAIEVIPNAVDTKFFSNKISEDSSNDLKEKLEKKDGHIFLITTSRLVPKNGVGDIIESLTYLPENYKLLVLGVGPLEKELKSDVLRLGLSSQVKFLGQIGYIEIPQYLQVSDIFVRPSLSEGMGNSFIEAMAAGVPVIATLVGGITDFLHDRWTGVAVKVNDPKDLAEKIKLLAGDQALREHIIRQAQKLVFEKYDWDLIAKDMVEKIFLKAI